MSKSKEVLVKNNVNLNIEQSEEGKHILNMMEKVKKGTKLLN